MKTAEAKPGASAMSKSSQPFFKAGKGMFSHKRGNDHGPFFSEQKRSFFKASNTGIQAKLSIGHPDDKYEKEADAMADKVGQRLVKTNTGVESKDGNTIRTKPVPPISSITTPFHVQPKCAFCEKEKKLPENEGTEGRGPMKNRLQEKPIVESNRKPSDDEKNIQSKCAECEKEEQLQRKENLSSRPSSNNLEHTLSRTKGSGSPMATVVRHEMESSFGTDFSEVRIHSGSTAAQLSKDLNAQAFTHGQDIYFGAGKYDPQTSNGKYLLAHELTHTVQQALPVTKSSIQKDSNPNPPGPKQALEEGLGGIQIVDDGTIASEDLAKNKRMALLIGAEEVLNDNPEYAKQVIAEYPVIENYVSDTLTNVTEIAASEEKTVTSLIGTKGLTVDEKEFYKDAFFAPHMDAFPESFLKIITPLIDPPYEEGNRLMADDPQLVQNVINSKTALPEYFFSEGLPFNKEQSIGLFDYELIKSKNLRLNYLKLFKEQPIFSSDLDYVTDPENRNLHTGALSMYQSSWTGRAINLYASVLYGNWKGNFDSITSQIKRGEISTIDANAIALFQQKYAEGLNSIRDLFLYAVDPTAVPAVLSPSDPAAFYAFTNLRAVLNASTQTGDFIKTEYGSFVAKLAEADVMVRNLSGTEKLGKSLRWSVKKGFAEEAIIEIIDNFGNILEDLLKEKVKKSIFERIVTFVASLHPLGRLAVLAYEVYQAAQTVNDVLDIISLIGRVVSTIDEASNSTKVVDVQRSAAKLADIYKEVIPLIVQKISDALAKRLMNRSSKRKAADDEPDEPKPSKTTDPSKHTGGHQDEPTPTKKSGHEGDEDAGAKRKQPEKDDPTKAKERKGGEHDEEPKIPAGRNNAHHAQVNDGKIEVCSHCKNLRNIVSGVIDTLETKGPDKSTRGRLEKIRDKIDKLEAKRKAGTITDAELLSGTNQILADLRATSIKSGLDSLGLFKEWETANAFEKRISSMTAGERVAEANKIAENRASLNGWEYDQRLSRMNGRDVYRDTNGDLYSVDTMHGRLERTNSRGKHQGEYDMDLRNTKGPDKSGGHDLTIR